LAVQISKDNNCLQSTVNKTKHLMHRIAGYSDQQDKGPHLLMWSLRDNSNLP
jgi:hypothetical protein